MKYILPLLIAGACLSACKGPGDPVVSADFPGGNIEVLKKNRDTLWLKPDLSETNGEWFYWYFKVSTIAERRLSFRFSLDNQFTSMVPGCEMMANYVLEGIIQAVLTDPALLYLRKQVEFMIIPFMDKDGVENGEQGKNRIPRDHNRDYNGASLYASTAALRGEVPDWADGKLRVALDLHCPWIKGENNEWIYLVGAERPSMEAAQRQFSRMLQENATGALKFRSEDFLPFGVAWNTGNNSTKGLSFSRWAGALDGIHLASTIEFPYGLILNEPVTAEKAREFGFALARTIQDYLMESNPM